MKHFKKYIYIACIISLLAACTDEFVDLEPVDKITPDVVYSTLEGIESSVYGLYFQAREYASWEDGPTYKIGISDLERAGTNMRDDNNYNRVFSLTSFDSQNKIINDIWSCYYKGLHKANLALNSLDKLTVENTPEIQARKNAVIGVLYFFRAYFHLQLVQRWDNIVLADHLFTDPSEKIELAPKKDVYDLIVSDLTTAIPLLPVQSTITEDRGHITKGAAQILLAKAYMDIEEWQKAADAAAAVIADKASYDLVGLEEWYSVKSQNNKEIILSWQFASGETSQRLTNRFLPLYDRLQGVKRSFKYGGRPYARLIPTDYYWTLFDKTNDLRWNAYHTHDYVYDTSNTTDELLPAGFQIGDTVSRTPGEFITVNGFGTEAFEPTTKKYYEDETLGRTIGLAEGYRNIIQFRLPEAMLIAAEAYIHLNRVADALPYINPIRNRAGVAPYTEATLTLNELIDEHARELAHEGNRYEMLKRLGILLERVQANNPTAGPVMQAFHVRWPIPYSFQKLTKVPQNEGYY